VLDWLLAFGSLAHHDPFLGEEGDPLLKEREEMVKVSL